MRPEIEAYLRQHGDRYTTEALRSGLIASGHDPAEVDAALSEMHATRTAQPSRPGQSAGSGLNDTAWALYLIGAGVGAGGALLLVALTGLVAGAPNPLIFVALYAVSYLGLGYLVVRLVRWAVAEFAIRGVVAVLIGLVLVPVYGALTFGLCVAAANLAAARGG